MNAIQHRYQLQKLADHLTSRIATRSVNGQRVDMEAEELAAIKYAIGLAREWEDIPDLIGDLKSTVEALLESRPTTAEREDALGLVEDAADTMRRIG